ncbi:MAG: hypothetical protein NUW37_06450 [Planctomycetes bacterium]|nr:hypothetical protein [Planctomycetota bacterium]
MDNRHEIGPPLVRYRKARLRASSLGLPPPNIEDYIGKPGNNSNSNCDCGRKNKISNNSIDIIENDSPFVTKSELDRRSPRRDLSGMETSNSVFRISRQEARRRMSIATIDAIRTMNVFYEGRTGFNSEEEIKQHWRQTITDIAQSIDVNASDSIPFLEVSSGDKIVGFINELSKLVAHATVDGPLSGVTPGFVGTKVLSFIIRPSLSNCGYVYSESGDDELILPVSSAFQVKVATNGSDKASVVETFAMYQGRSLDQQSELAIPWCFSLDPEGPPSVGVVDLRTGDIECIESLKIAAPGMARAVPWSVLNRGILLKTGSLPSANGNPASALLFSQSRIPAEVPVIGGLLAQGISDSDEPEPAPEREQTQAERDDATASKLFAISNLYELGLTYSDCRSIAVRNCRGAVPGRQNCASQAIGCATALLAAADIDPEQRQVNRTAVVAAVIAALCPGG